MHNWIPYYWALLGLSCPLYCQEKSLGVLWALRGTDGDNLGNLKTRMKSAGRSWESERIILLSTYHLGLLPTTCLNTKRAGGLLCLPSKLCLNAALHAGRLFSNQRLRGGKSWEAAEKVSVEWTQGKPGTARPSTHGPPGRLAPPREFGHSLQPRNTLSETPTPTRQWLSGSDTPRTPLHPWGQWRATSPSLAPLRVNRGPKHHQATGMSRRPPTRVVGQARAPQSLGLPPGPRASCPHFGTAGGRWSARRLSPRGAGPGLAPACQDAGPVPERARRRRAAGSSR